MSEGLLEELLHETNFPGNAAAFAGLREYLAQGDLTALTGAGVSAPTFPTWMAMLSKWLNEAFQQGFIGAVEITEYKELLKNDPLELAEFLEQILTKPIFRARLAEIFRNKSAQATDCHRLISDLPIRGIVTLNYDNGHEIAYAAKGRNPNQGKAQDEATMVRWMQSEVFNDADRPILHFHGDISDPNQMVLTSSDYDQFYSRELPDAFLRQLWTTHRLLVIGFGFSDPFLIKVAERTLRALPTDTRHYALIGKDRGETVSPIQRKMFARKYRVIPIFYEVRCVESGNVVTHDHADLLALIKELKGSPKSNNNQPSSNSNTPATTGGLGLETVVAPSVEVDFQKDLFVAPGGKTLYAEPRFTSDDQKGVRTGHVNYVSIPGIVADSASYVISCRPEYGATTIARRLVLDFAGAGKRALLRDAVSLPNYKKKLEDHFAAVQHDGILILDNFDVVGNERLLKEVMGTKIFSRIILLARQNLFETGSPNLSDQFLTPFKALQLMNLSRADIRTITHQFYETSDNDTISAIVEKVYSDLVTLCIPITPANIVMYLTILCKDHDFQPINRVQIVRKYLSELLIGPSDVYRDAFNAKNKMDVISAFVFHQFSSNKTTFTEADWFAFCREHMSATLTKFDERNLLSLLKSNRVLVPVGHQLYFKYRFFHVFFLGRHIASRPSTLAACMAQNDYLRHDGLVEVLTELASENEPLVLDIAQKLNDAMDDFDQRFIPESFDPFAELDWPSDKDEEEKLWQPLMRELTCGPRNVAEIDQIKSSLFKEQIASDQKVVVRDFDRIERRLISFVGAAGTRRSPRPLIFWAGRCKTSGAWRRGKANVYLQLAV
jgi:hypothetical protein